MVYAVNLPLMFGEFPNNSYLLLTPKKTTLGNFLEAVIHKIIITFLILIFLIGELHAREWSSN